MKLKDWILSTCVKNFLVDVSKLQKVMPESGILRINGRNEAELEFRGKSGQLVDISMGKDFFVEGSTLYDKRSYEESYHFLYDVITMLVHKDIDEISFVIDEDGKRKPKISRIEGCYGGVRYNIVNIGVW